MKKAPVARHHTRRLFPIARSLEVDGRGRRKAFARGDRSGPCRDTSVIIHDVGFISILRMCQWMDVIRERFS